MFHVSKWRWTLAGVGTIWVQFVTILVSAALLSHPAFHNLFRLSLGTIPIHVLKRFSLWLTNLCLRSSAGHILSLWWRQFCLTLHMIIHDYWAAHTSTECRPLLNSCGIRFFLFQRYLCVREWGRGAGLPRGNNASCDSVWSWTRVGAVSNTQFMPGGCKFPLVWPSYTVDRHLAWLEGFVSFLETLSKIYRSIFVLFALLFVWHLPTLSATPSSANSRLVCFVTLGKWTLSVV